MPPVLAYPVFLAELARLPMNAGGSGPHHAVAVVDFEGLSELDGVVGYAAVDEIARQAAARLTDALQSSGQVGMTGRHQLACLLYNLPGPDYATLAGHKILRVLSPAFEQDERKLVVSPRIGIALNDSSSTDPERMLRNARSAVRQARLDRESLRLYEAGSDDPLLLGVNLWSDLGHAIEGGQLHLVYQPQLNLSTSRIDTTEGLLRWKHPTRGPIRPDTMIQIAEGTGLMSRLTLWVLNTALRQCAEYRKAGLKAGVSVNISADDLREPDLPELVAQGLDLWGVPPDEIIIELTETAMMEGRSGAIDVLHRLKDMGLKISMDDFGTGYSSMARLLNLPLDEVKIDMTFIRDLTRSEPHERIVDSMIGLGHRLGLNVVAEGVEDATTLERLRALGCDMAQGYYIGRPVPLDELIATAVQVPGGTREDTPGQVR